MFTRVVRFTGVEPGRLEEMRSRIDEGGGPPEGVDMTGLQVLADGEQGTVVVLQHFATREAMEQGARVFAAMDASETPGQRASVDTCEVVLELSP